MKLFKILITLSWRSKKLVALLRVHSSKYQMKVQSHRLILMVTLSSTARINGITTRKPKEKSISKFCGIIFNQFRYDHLKLSLSSSQEANSSLRMVILSSIGKMNGMTINGRLVNCQSQPLLEFQHHRLRLNKRLMKLRCKASGTMWTVKLKSSPLVKGQVTNLKLLEIMKQYFNHLSNNR